MTHDLYVEKIAYTSRNMLIDAKVIPNEPIKYEKAILTEIVKFFGGELEIVSGQTEEHGDYIKKVDSKNAFLIHLNQEGTSRSIPIRVFHELGHAFLDIPEMEINEMRFYDGNKRSDIQAELFMRSFIMPVDGFENIAKKCIKDGKFDVKKIADQYHVDYIDAMVRGKELNYWE